MLTRQENVFQVLCRLGKMTEEETKKRLSPEVSHLEKTKQINKHVPSPLNASILNR